MASVSTVEIQKLKAEIAALRAAIEALKQLVDNQMNGGSP
jgi:peptidoglycan hydrolase CwlO-like protein